MVGHYTPPTFKELKLGVKKAVDVIQGESYTFPSRGVYCIGRANFAFEIIQITGTNSATNWFLNLMAGTDISDKFEYNSETHTLTSLNGTIRIYMIN